MGSRDIHAFHSKGINSLRTRIINHLAGFNNLTSSFEREENNGLYLSVVLQTAQYKQYLRY